MISTFNRFHLGDNLVHLHFMRKLAIANPEGIFGHYAEPNLRPQLSPLVEDLPNLKLLTEIPGDALNAWRGAGNFWYNHPKRNDFAAFHIEWFAHLADKMGLANPINEASDMLFDYPVLSSLRSEVLGKYDVLVINSIPHSGQFRAYNPHAFEAMIRHLLAKGQQVITTQPTATDAACTSSDGKGLSVTMIGAISCHVGKIVGIATGPMWPTFNIFNRDALRVIMLDEERVELTPNTKHVRSYEEAMQYI